MKLLVLLTVILCACNLYAEEKIIGDPEIGAYKSVGCKGCHGENGVAKQRMHPSLAGQNEGYLIWQLNSFREAKRQSHIMNHIAGSLTDRDIADLAVHYAQQSPCIDGDK